MWSVIACDIISRNVTVLCIFAPKNVLPCCNVTTVVYSYKPEIASYETKPYVNWYLCGNKCSWKNATHAN